MHIRVEETDWPIAIGQDDQLIPGPLKATGRPRKDGDVRIYSGFN